MSVESVSSRAWRRPALAPRGKIVSAFRLREKAADGRVKSVSGLGLLVTVRPDAKSRREFRRYCLREGVTARPVRDGYENAPATFWHAPDPLTGRAVPRAPEHHTPRTFECVGPLDALRRLGQHPSVERAEHALSARAPRAQRPDPVAPVPTDIPATVRRNIVAARRAGAEYAAERERERHAPFIHPGDDAGLVATCAAFGIDPAAPVVWTDSDGEVREAPAVALVAELVRFATRGAALTSAESARVAVLRARLGI